VSQRERRDEGNAKHSGETCETGGRARREDAWGMGKKVRRERKARKARNHFNFESREFLILLILAPKTTILRLKTDISGTMIFIFQ